ncbi:MAG: DUF3368 domain-containing protein [Chitinophagales bacterium]
MPKAIISDASCLIVLTNIGELELLHEMYEQIVTTTEVAEEFGLQLPEWIEIKKAVDKYRKLILEIQIDSGEASAIALALEFDESLLILDDYKARKVAEHLGLEITGTIGIIIKAKIRGLIPSIKPYLEKIRQTDFRMSDELERLALKEAGE